MQVIAIFDEFEELSTYDPKDVPGLAIAMDHLPVDVYWPILSIVACSTKICILTSDEEKALDLAPYSQKVHYILNKLKMYSSYFAESK
ncbi:Sieve element occlusion, N-terminal [Trema orientale]|uniref:Sieve element occlusion, N-terminal n=1 Tax=Trema orientale TaxID=63057 RepID=A0A2P5DXT0_TREOI|nr:Sieve element occlusion, N-terminal [Trema orientale]